MAEIVSSAVVQETVSQVLSNLVKKYGEKDESNKHRNLERLEMAHTRLDAVLEISDRWQITDASLLRWRSKLKRVAQECDGTLHSCKQRIVEDEETENEVRKSPFPKRIARTTRSFVSSIFGPNKDELMNSSIARRFEWFADGASEFIRLVELGGTPRRHMPFNPLTRYLLAGKKLHHTIIQENGSLFLLLVPFTTSEYGIEALVFIQKEGNVGEDDILLALTVQISESTDIVGITMKSIELFTPLFKSTVENIRKEVLQLPTEDFSWVPNIDTPHKEQLDNILSLGTQWLRPNPLCCKQHDERKLDHGSKLGSLGLQDVCLDLEPVISVNLQCHVSVSGCNKHRALLSEFRNSQQDSPSLKAGINFSPHGYSEEYLHVDTSPVIAAIYTEEQHFLHTEFTFGQLEEIMMPKAIDYFYKNEKATIYQMLWRSKHGTAYISVEKESILIPSTHGMMQPIDESMNWSYGVSQFANQWVMDAPIELQASIKDSISFVVVAVSRQLEKSNTGTLSSIGGGGSTW